MKSVIRSFRVLALSSLLIGCGGGELPESEYPSTPDPVAASERRKDHFELKSSDGTTTLLAYRTVERLENGSWTEREGRIAIASEGYFLIIPDLVGDLVGTTDDQGTISWPGVALTQEQLNATKVISIRGNPYCQRSSAPGEEPQCRFVERVENDENYQLRSSNLLPMRNLLEKGFADPCKPRGLVALDFTSGEAGCDQEPGDEGRSTWLCHMERTVTCGAPPSTPTPTVEFAMVFGNGKADVDAKVEATLKGCELLGFSGQDAGGDGTSFAGLAWICGRYRLRSVPEGVANPRKKPPVAPLDATSEPE